MESEVEEVEEEEERNEHAHIRRSAPLGIGRLETVVDRVDDVQRKADRMPGSHPGKEVLSV